MHRSGLLLLVLCAASLVPPGGTFGNRKLCGIQLVEALLLVCGEKGVFYQPGRRVREENTYITVRDRVPVLRNLRAFLERGSHGAKVENRGTVKPRVTKRGIVEQCCHFYCDYYDLENYCNT
ncbi:insulin [Chanos chanos]|uniref:Insulin n=1 Tax=Chanos chanos TaxID=29144 RepID=A0A6J2WZM2_CHACN|nr:insulin-like [Chanos chanos]